MLPGLIALLFFGPLIELYLLIEIGASIGGGTTILLCILTAVLGAVLVRWQGLETLLQAERRLMRGELPAVEALHGAMITFAGVLLFFPGFLTDAIGFLLLVPFVRRWIIARYFPEARWASGERDDVITVRIVDDDEDTHPLP